MTNPNSHWLAQLERARTLIRTPYAPQILRGLREGLQPSDAVPPGTKTQELTDAIALLERMELIHTRAADRPEPQAELSISHNGEQLATALSSCDEVDRLLISTPWAAEILCGLRDGVQPSDAVPLGTNPQEIADAVALLENLKLIHSWPVTAGRPA